MRKLTFASLAIGFGQILLLGQTYQQTFEHARSSLKQKQFAEALDEARQAVHLDNTRWEGWFVAGTAAVGLEKNDLALDYFNEALTRAPDSAKPTINDAIAACRQILANKTPPRHFDQPPVGGPAALEGTVKGPNGLPLKGVLIIFERTDDRGIYGVQTDKNGHYYYGGLPLGVFKITLEVDGREVDSVRQVQTRRGDPIVNDFAMRANNRQ